MIDWIDGMCRIWAYQSHKRDTRSVSLPCTNGRIIEEGDGAAIGGTFGHKILSESLSGAALEVHRALQFMDEDARTIITCHYRLRKPVKAKAHALKKAVSTYWYDLNAAHKEMARIIESDFGQSSIRQTATGCRM